MVATARVVPAQLAFLAVYCPALGASDEAFRDQLVFYYAKPSARRRADDDNANANDDAARDQALRDDENARLRQIGLAQGMIDFARSFSDDAPIDHVDTEKSRIVMHELEEGWWILASIDLTRLPAPPSLSKPSPADAPSSPAVEYSAREVAPPELLLQQLVRAHNIFRLHHGPSLADLYARLSRQKFCSTLDRFWARFAKDWDVLLHGNPAIDVYPGIKLAAGGELGMGVGEEEWGSGEREVFEDFTARTDGLVDMVVSRFGEPLKGLHADSRSSTPLSKTDLLAKELGPWMGAGRSPEAADGVIFSGVGAISRSSLRDVSSWMQWLYTYGEHAYGVKDNPSSDRRRRRRRDRASKPHNRLSSHSRAASQSSARKLPSRTSSSLPPGIPRPIVTAVEQSLDQASSAAHAAQERERAENEQTSSEGDTWFKYLTLGYGSSWSGNRPQPEHRSSQQSIQGNGDEDQEKTYQTSMRHLDPDPDVDPLETALKTQIRRENIGHFLVGLQGDLDEDVIGDSENAQPEDEDAAGSNWESRTLLRTLHVKTKGRGAKAAEEDSSGATILPAPDSSYEKLRVIVYVHRPFITAMLFEARTSTLPYPTFYRHLHSYLAPLHKPLSNSTSPARVAARIAASSNPYTTSVGNGGPNTQPIYDLIYDPLHLTIHSSVPNIPEPGTASAEGLGLSSNGTTSASWTRVEALNVHSQILATLSSTKRAPNDIERTAKTSRGWWLVWMRLPPSEHVSTGLSGAPSPNLAATGNRTPSAKASSSSLKSLASSTSNAAPADEPEANELDAQPAKVPSLPTASLREALLIRRSREAGPPAVRSSRHGGGASASGGSIWRLGLGGGSSAAATGGAAAGWGPRGLAEGVGIDARRYIEGLLSLSR